MNVDEILREMTQKRESVLQSAPADFAIECRAREYKLIRIKLPPPTVAYPMCSNVSDPRHFATRESLPRQKKKQGWIQPFSRTTMQDQVHLRQRRSLLRRYQIRHRRKRNGINHRELAKEESPLKRGRGKKYV